MYIAQRQEFAPRSHDVAFLAGETNLRPQLDTTLLQLQDLYFLLRYPELEGPLPFALATREDAQKIIRLTTLAIPMIQTECEDAQKERSEEVKPPESE